MNTYSTNIMIGGAIHADRLPALLDAAADSHASLDWNERALRSTAEDLAALRKAIDEAARLDGGGPLRLFNDSAVNGRLEPLERFCRKEALAYVRSHDPDHGETGITTWWQSGMSEPTSREADADGEPFIYVRDVMAAIDSAKTNKAALAAVRDLAKRATPFDVCVLTVLDAV